MYDRKCNAIEKRKCYFNTGNFNTKTGKKGRKTKILEKEEIEKKQF